MTHIKWSAGGRGAGRSSARRLRGRPPGLLRRHGGGGAGPRAQRGERVCGDAGRRRRAGGCRRRRRGGRAGGGLCERARRPMTVKFNEKCCVGSLAPLLYLSLSRSLSLDISFSFLVSRFLSLSHTLSISTLSSFSWSISTQLCGIT
jgi:hypothetical protein